METCQVSYDGMFLRMKSINTAIILTVKFNRKISRMRFDNHIWTQKVFHEIAKGITGNNDRKHRSEVIVAMRSTEFATNPPNGGYARTPQKSFAAVMKLHARMMLIDEYRTTKQCSRCYRRLEYKRSNGEKSQERNKNKR